MDPFRPVISPKYLKKAKKNFLKNNLKIEFVVDWMILGRNYSYQNAVQIVLNKIEMTLYSRFSCLSGE